MPVKTVLILPPSWGTDCPPYGIAVLKGCLRQRGHAVKTFDLNVNFYKESRAARRKDWDPSRHLLWMDPAWVAKLFDEELKRSVERWTRKVAAEKPRIVGFSTVFSNQAAGLYLAERIKRALPDCLVVFGGPQASEEAGAQRILESGFVDFTVEGEGEAALAELVERVERGEDPAGGRGLRFMKNGVMTGTPLHALMPDLSKLPPADYSDFSFADYRGRLLPVSLSRGCPNKCTFCYEVQYWKRFRVRKAKSLVAEVVWQRMTGARFDGLWFHDSLINGNMLELKRFAQGLIDAGVRTRWISQAVIRKEMTRDVLQLLKDSGCTSLNYGLESASFVTMLRMGKILAKDADLDRIMRDTVEVGIENVLNFMFGYPGETEEDFQVTLDFVRRNKDWISMVSPSPGFCDFHRGTYGFSHLDELGIELKDATAHWVSKDGRNTYLTRMERFERFMELVYQLGIKSYYPHRRIYMRNTIIGGYHYMHGRYNEAIPFLEQALVSDPPSEEVPRRLEECRRRAAELGSGVA